MDTHLLQGNSSHVIFLNVKHRTTKRDAFSFQILNIIEGAPPIIKLGVIEITFIYFSKNTMIHYVVGFIILESNV